MVTAEWVGRAVRVKTSDALKRVTLVDQPGSPKVRVFGDPLVEQVIYLALRCGVVALEAGGSYDVRFVLRAEIGVQPASQNNGDVGIGDVATLLRDGAELIEGRQKWFRVRLRASVYKASGDNGLPKAKWSWLIRGGEMTEQRLTSVWLTFVFIVYTPKLPAISLGIKLLF